MNLRNNQITVGELLDNPQSRYFLLQQLPIIVHHPMISSARAMTLERAITLGAGWLPQQKIAQILDGLQRI